ncbi:MAG TPA: hypothetical protein VK841_14890 [Polyangiaceae bacterium]|jgi:hypothetical protein|nr:hypothetical protein [Polyangiaceae bacterium]
MNQVTTQFIADVPVRRTRAAASLLAERVRDFACTFGGCDAGREVRRDLWARAAGRHIIVGRGDDEAFARITPLGEEAYGLAFRAPASANGASADADTTSPSRWAPLLLIDALADVVEHALIGESAMDQRALPM